MVSFNSFFVVVFIVSLNDKSVQKRRHFLYFCQSQNRKSILDFGKIVGNQNRF